VIYVLALLAVLGIFLELLGTFGFAYVSRIQRRTDSEYQAALRIRPVDTGNPTLLLAGNSLILEGIDMPAFRRELAPAYSASRLVVEQTMFLDWYYGLHRLFLRGSRPSLVLLGLSVRHLVNNGVRGEYFARYLMTISDFPEVVKRENLDRTAASTLLFANLSGWIGSKSEIRNWLLGRTLPDLEKLTPRLSGPIAPPPDAEMTLRIVGERLAALKKLCGDYGARIVVVLPPTNEIHDPYNAVEQAGIKSAVPVMIAFQPGEMPSGNYRDGFHLNAEGAKIFTHRLAGMLLEGRGAREPGRRMGETPPDAP
jgi:hypothetical protein